MDGRGGCCIARYSAGAAYDTSKMDRIMLRFRPIAPKPVSKGGDSANSTAEIGDAYVKTGRSKRRYVRNNSNADSNNGSGTKRCNTGRKRKSSSSSLDGSDKTFSGGSASGGNPVVTLPLLPETPDRKDSPARGSPSNSGGGDQKGNKTLPMWLSFGKEELLLQEQQQDSQVMGHVTSFGGPEKMVVTVPQPVRVVGAWVRVECITDTWVDLYGLGPTDEEKLLNLEADTCPGFLSDGLNRVQWTNKAYRSMMTEGIHGDLEVVVWLVMKEGVKLPITSRAFTCSVRLVTCWKEKSLLTLPCDVWRMDCGGFAWRLDIGAALSLGR